MFKALLFVAAAVVLASAAPADEQEVIKGAIVKLEGGDVKGSVTFIRDGDNLRITGTVTGMPAGDYGFTVHESGDITKGCDATGGHFNPDGHDHGHPDEETSHAGDLGNIKFDNTKTAKFDFLARKIKLNGKYSIIGRSVVLHAGKDDHGKTDHPDSKTTGNAGAHVACGVIGIL